MLFADFRTLVGRVVLPVLVFSWLFPLLGVLNVSGTFASKLLAGILFAVFSAGAVHLAETFTFTGSSSTPKKVFWAIIVTPLLTIASMLAVAAVLTSVTVNVLSWGMIAVFAFPLLRDELIGV